MTVVVAQLYIDRKEELFDVSAAWIETEQKEEEEEEEEEETSLAANTI